MNFDAKNRFLDRAAIITFAENSEEIKDRWWLCSITQVEEVKCILRLLPIWMCTLLTSGIFIQMLSLFVEQGAAMDTTVSSFQVPPASLTAFDIVSTSAFILLYDKLILPLYVKVMKREPRTQSELERIGIGLIIAILAMICAGFVEQYRLKHAGIKGEEASSLNILWQIPQYILLGVSEAFVYVAQMEFFASQSPDRLKSLGIGLSMSSFAIGTYLCSLILTIVTAVTSREGKLGWVPPNLNEGHLDRFFFLSAALTMFDLGLFIVCAKRYKSISFDNGNKNDEVELS